MEAQYSKNEIKFDAPILLELMDKDFKYTRAKREQNDAKNKKKKKIKEEEKDKRRRKR